MSVRTLVKGGCVLSMSRSVGNHAAADVLVENGVIAEIGPNLRARDAEVIDADEAIVMPGFVDTHRHVSQSLFRNVGGEKGRDYDSYLDADDVYAATLIGLLGAAASGITTVADWVAVDPEHLDAVVSAHRDAGIRTVLVAAPGEGSLEAALDRLRGDLSAGIGSRTTLGGGSDDPASMAPDRVAGLWGAVRERGLRVHAHVGTGPGQGGTVAALAGDGLLGSDVTLVHCTRLEDRDLDVIADTGAAVAITPAYEMTSGMGAPPLQALIDRGIRPGLGVGRETEGPGDVFAQMRAVNSLQHATLFDLKLAGKSGVPNLLSTREVLRYGTVDGANAIGLGETTGSLTPGRQADLLVLRADRPNISPINDPIGAVVWGMDTSNIGWVMVGGEVILRDGVMTADVDAARDHANAAHRKVAAAAGLAPAGGAR